MPFGRRDLFRFGAVGSAGLLGALAWPVSKWLGSSGPPKTSAPVLGFDCTSDGISSREAAAYAARYSPPDYVAAGSRDALHLPPPPGSGNVGGLQEIDLPVIQTTLEVANGRNVQVWAYGGTVPGPILRATVGDQLRVRMANHSSTPHTVHFHGAHDVSQDGLGRIAPGDTQVYEFTAGPIGLHPYHCHVPPYAWHMGKGMYGALIVDPVGGGRRRMSSFCACAASMSRAAAATTRTHGTGSQVTTSDSRSRFPSANWCESIS